MNSRVDSFNVEEYNFEKTMRTMNSLIDSNDMYVSKEPNIENIFSDNILNSDLVDNDTKLDNPFYNEKMCLEEFDRAFSDFDMQYDKCDCHIDDVNYNILDLDNMEYITLNSEINTSGTKFNDSGVNYFINEHNYCKTKDGTQTFGEKFDTWKLEDFYKSGDYSFNDTDNFNGLEYCFEEIDEYYKYCTEYNLQESNFESGDFEIITDHFIDNISIHMISDDEEKIDDIEEPELDVTSISSESYIDSNSCGYHSSDFEFIDEEEAKRDGLIITNNSQTVNNDKVKTIEISKELSPRDLFIDSFNETDLNNIKHEIPQDANYVSMFEGNIPYPIHCMEHKFIHTKNCSMLAEYQGLGFNMSLYGCEKVEKHVIYEANESKNKILFMYPIENRRIHQ